MYVNFMIVTACLAGLNGPLAGRGLDLRPTFVAGQVIRYHSGSTIEHRSAGMSSPDVPSAPVTLQTEALMTLDIVRADAIEGTTLVWTLERFAIRSTAPIPGLTDRIDYDSGAAGASASPLSTLFEPLLDHPMTLRIDGHGRVLEVTGRPQFESASALRPMAEGFFSEQMFQQLPFFVTAHAPQPARRRSSWDDRATVPLGMGLGDIELHNRYRIEEISTRKKTADISLRGTMRAPAAASALQLDDADFAGEIVWDTAHGHLLSATSRMTIRATIQNLIGPLNISQRIDSWVERVPTPEQPGTHD